MLSGTCILLLFVNWAWQCFSDYLYQNAIQQLTFFGQPLLFHGEPLTGTDVRYFNTEQEKDGKSKRKFFWSNAENFVHTFIGPTSLAVLYELSLGQLTAWSVHIWSQSSSCWMAPHPDTWTSKSVRTWIWWKQWRCSQHRFLVAYAFTMAVWHVQCVLSLSIVTLLSSIVISRQSFSSVMSTVSLQGSEELDDIYHKVQVLSMCIRSAILFFSGCRINSLASVSEVNVSSVNHKGLFNVERSSVMCRNYC